MASSVNPVPPQLSVCCAGAVPLIEQLEPQPAPVSAPTIDQFRPAIFGSGSLSVTFFASPAPVLKLVIVNPIGSPAFTVDGESAVFTMLRPGGWTQMVASELAEPSLPVVTLPVLSTSPPPGHDPALVPSVPEVT